MPSRQRLARFLLIPVLAVAACGPGGGTTAPGSLARTGGPSPPAATDVAAVSLVPSGGANQAAQTETDWGRIWDSLPAGFPPFPGSVPGDEAAAGPASANLVVQGADAKAVATFYQSALTTAGYATDGLSGPLEDGGYVLDMTGPTGGCKVQVTAAPTGGFITLRILYGSACPSV